MRLSELSGKEVINIGDGARLGLINECELTFDAGTGEIDAMILPVSQSFFHFLSDTKVSAIPWDSIKKIGDDVIIIELQQAGEPSNSRMFRRVGNT